MHSLPAGWLPVSIAPSDGDLEVCALDYDGIVHALVVPVSHRWSPMGRCFKRQARRHSADALAQMDREPLNRIF